MASTIFQSRSGDFGLFDNGNGKRGLRLVRNTANAAGIKLRNRWFFHRGEWYQDLRLGIPWREIVFRKGTPLAIVQRLLTDVLLSLSPVVERVDRVESAVDPKTRELHYYFEATMNDGATLTGGTDRPFIVGNEYNAE